MSGSGSALRTFGDADIEVKTFGSGPPLLFLHGDDGLVFSRPFVELLGQHFEVTVPSHPGWGSSPRADRFRSFDDVAYVYLDLLEQLDGPVPVVGASIGAWLALEVATKSTADVAALALVAPVGIRTGPPTVRHYLDRYAVDAEGLASANYGSAARRPDLSLLADADFEELARAQEAAAFFTWEPYMHSATLLSRLSRVRIPTLLVTGECDGIVLAPDHAKTIALRLGADSESVSLPGVGHRIEEEAPAELVAALTSFLTPSA